MKALVTGAARGIGAAIAARLVADDHEVVTLDRLEGCTHRLDLARDALPALDDIEICVSNAAITTTIAPAHRMTLEQWRGDIDVNLTGAFRVIQACLPGMRERGFGRVIAISSMAATRGLPGQVAYAASKAGLLGMVKTLAAENAGTGITANAVLPGLVATEAVRAMPREVLDRVTAQLPGASMVAPDEIAGLVAFLTTGAAAHVTGQEIGVDGGMGLNTGSLARGGPRD